MKYYLNTIEKKSHVVWLALLCFGAYAISYIGRLNYSAALPDMISGGILTKTDGGVCATIYFAAYGIGQIINGFLADRFDPRKQIVMGIGASGVLNLFMPMAASRIAMMLIWGVNGYAQSLIWAPCFLIISQGIHWKYSAKALLLLNTAPSFGTILAYSFSGAVLEISPWQSLFSLAGTILFTGAVFFAVSCLALYRSQGEIPGLPEEQGQEETAGKKKNNSAMGAVVSSGVLLLILPTMINGMLKDGVTSWLPTYMTEVFSMSSGKAVRFSLLLPVINMSGATIAYWLMQKVRNEAVCASLLFGCAAVCLCILPVADALPPVATVMVFAAVTALMMASSVVIISEIPTHFVTMGVAASVSGFLNACSYAGTAVSMYGIAWVTENFGWTVTQYMYIAAGILAVLSTAAEIPVWKRFARKTKR